MKLVKDNYNYNFETYVGKGSNPFPSDSISIMGKVIPSPSFK